MFLNGGTPSRDIARYYKGHIPWITSADLKEGSEAVTEARFHITEEAIQSSATRVVPKGNILFVSRTGVGKVAIAEMDVCISQDFTGIVPNTKLIHTRYLFRFLQANQSYFVYRQRGATIKGVTRRVIEELDVPLPPLPEQRRIAAILDAADGLRAKRRAALGKLDALVQAVFLEMFGDPVRNERGWDTYRLGELINDGPQNGLYRHASHYGSGTPIIRINSFYGGKVTNLEKLNRVQLDLKTQNHFRVSEGDILINRVNSREYLGKSAIVPRLKEPTVFESNMMRFSVDRNRILPEFLVVMLQQDHLKRQIMNRCKDAVNQSSINQEDVMSFEVRVPPLSLQHNYIETQKRITSMRNSQSKNLSYLESLFSSLQNRAFRGEL